MRLIDADGIKDFASRYTEFDGEPLTDRERDIVRNVCGKIGAMMPTAYDLEGVVEALKKGIRDTSMCQDCDKDIYCDECRAEKAEKIVRGDSHDKDTKDAGKDAGKSLKHGSRFPVCPAAGSRHGLCRHDMDMTMAAGVALEKQK